MASKYSSVTLSGEITRAQLETELPKFIDGILNTVGKETSQEMKRIIEDSTRKGASGELADSMMYTTRKTSSKMGSKSPSTNELDKPGDPYTCYIGSGAPHAKYVDRGTGPHKSREGTEEFIASMREWFNRETGMNSEDNGMGEEAFWKIVNSIRANGTDAYPFLTPGRYFAIDSAIRAFRLGARKLWGAKRGAKK